MSVARRYQLLALAAGLLFLPAVLMVVAPALPGEGRVAYELWKAQRRAARGEFGAAMRHYDAAAAIAPRDARPHVQAAAIYSKLGLVEQATASYQAALDRDAEEADALLGLGRMAVVERQWTKAVGYLLRAEKLRPSDFETKLELGNVLAAANESSRARQVLESALSLTKRDDKGGEALHLKLALLLAAEDRRTAVEHLGLARSRPDGQDAVFATLSTALELPADADGEAHFHALLGYLYLDNDWPGLARAQLERAQALKPGYGDRSTYLGMAYWREGRVEEAHRALRAAVELSPEAPLPHYFLGIVLLDERRLPEAAEAFRRAVALDVANPALHMELARTLDALGDFGAAAEAYEDGLRSAEQDGDLKLDLSFGAATFYLDHLFRLERGYAIAEALWEANRGSTQVAELWARALQLRGDRAAALEVLEQAMASDPTAATLRLREAEIREQLGERDAAARSYELVLDLDVGPTAAVAKRHLAELR